MSAHILAAINDLPQLSGTLRHQAQRLALFANNAGTLQRSYASLANDRHVHISTAKRLIARLLEVGIIEKTVLRLSRTRCAQNVYRFAKWVLDLVPKCSSSRMRQPEKEREKSPRAREELSAKGAAWLRTVGLKAEGVFLQWCAGP